MAKLILDTGPLVALLNRDERLHSECLDFFKTFRGLLISTEPVLTEALYLLNNSLKHQQKCIEFVQTAVQLIPSSRISLQRCSSLIEKYKDVPMDFADATLVVLAEEIQTQEIFTLDHRGFQIYRWGRNHTFKIYPE